MESARAALAAIWPLYGLSIHTPRLTLRIPLDVEIAELAQVARDIRSPIFVNGEEWAQRPSPELERGVMQFYWRNLAEWQPDNWRLNFAVFRNEDGRVIGEQSIQARDFLYSREAATGSWLGHEFQGQGYGTEMRQAVVTLGFIHLRAGMMESDYWISNDLSKAVSRKLGYCPSHMRVEKYGDGKLFASLYKQYVELIPATWVKPDYAVEVKGFEPCLPMFDET